MASAVKRMRSPMAPAPPKMIALRRFSVEAACRHPDDDGVIPGKHEVDDDDAKDRR